MGACGSTSPGTQDHAESIRIDQKISQALSKECIGAKAQIKLLLLGAGECGKSTILKQMKIIHNHGFNESEKKMAIELVHRNTLQSIQALCQACRDLEIPFSDPANNTNADIILSHVDSNTLKPSDIAIIQHLWHDEGIQRALSRQNEFVLLDSAPYFLDCVERTFAPDYHPTDQDILRTRLATCGVIETDFWIDKLNFKMFDVGGQRGERKKWIHCFEDVRAILFIASLNEYDQVLAEDRTRNRLLESLSLFEGIISLPWFKTTAIILFLNKNDLFAKKVLRTDLGIYFNAYVGGLDYEEGLYFIKEMFFSKNQNPAKTIYAHVTDATDTNHIAFVWKCTKHIVMQQNLTRAGLMMC